LKEVGGLEKIDVSFTFGQTEYTRAVRQYLLAGRIVRKRDFFILPLIFILLLSALFYSRFNSWVLLLTLLCLVAVALICYQFFFKPGYDYYNKAQLRAETRLSFSEDGVMWPGAERPGPAAETTRELGLAAEAAPLSEQPENPGVADAAAPAEADAAASGAADMAASAEAELAVPAAEEAAAQPEEQVCAQNSWPGASKPAPPQPPKTSGASSPFRRGKRNSGYISWSMFAEVWENREFFFLIRQPHLYYIVPKHAFASQEEMQYFLRMLYRRVGIVELVSPYPAGH
jgi:Ca2+/Na+ antiporter